jgi:carbon storage regulator CsrA
MMLVLTRKEGESVRIGDDVKIVNLGKNKFGIRAPRHVLVLRGELELRGRKESREGRKDSAAGGGH